MNQIRLLIVDDHPVVRAGLKTLLSVQPDMVVVGEAADGEAALEQVAALRPDIVIMDITLGGFSGLEATRQIKKRFPETKVLVLTMHESEEYLRLMLEAGATGYVLKKAANTELVVAIRAVQRGEIYLYPSFTRILLADRFHGHEGVNRSAQDSIERLSDRERQVLRLVAQGYTSREIAEQLYLSARTIETYRSRLMSKLGIKSRVGLVRFALSQGLLDDVIDGVQDKDVK
ncbi:MAG: response regulator transcription factor [Chloroflexi bacterium]|nr:response regulator transcription factor [Chloroflexota bacterium]